MNQITSLSYSHFVTFLFCSILITLCYAHKIHERDLYFEVLEPSDIRYTFRCRPASNFGTKFNRAFKNIYLIPAKPLEGCSHLRNRFEAKGNILLIERGQCSFVTKVLNAEESGALGVIIMDNDPKADDYFLEMIDDMTERDVHIPAMFLQYRDGRLIVNSIEKNHLSGARINIPLNLTYNEMLKVHRAPGSHWL